MSQENADNRVEKRHHKKSKSGINGAGEKRQSKHDLDNGTVPGSSVHEVTEPMEEVSGSPKPPKSKSNGSAKDEKKRKHAQLNGASPDPSSRKKSKPTKDTSGLSLQPDSAKVEPPSRLPIATDSTKSTADVSQPSESSLKVPRKEKKKKISEAVVVDLDPPSQTKTTEKPSKPSKEPILVEGISPDLSLIANGAPSEEAAEPSLQGNFDVHESSKKSKNSKNKHVQFKGAPTETWSFQNLEPPEEGSKSSVKKVKSSFDPSKLSKQTDLEAGSSESTKKEEESSQTNLRLSQQHDPAHASPNSSVPNKTGSSNSIVDLAEEPDLGDALVSPFYTQRASLYVPVPSVAMKYAARGLRSNVLSQLILKYHPPLKGMVLAYDNVQLSTLARSVDEYADTFLWLTADFLVFRPTRGDKVEGWLNIESEGHVGLICWNLFNARIDGSHLPESWSWAEPLTTNRRSKARLKNDGRSDRLDSQQASHYTATNNISDYQGHYEDEDGNQISGTISFTVEDVEVSSNAARDRSYFMIEGTMKTESTQADSLLTNGASTTASGVNLASSSKPQSANPRKRRRRKDHDMEVD